MDHDGNYFEAYEVDDTLVEFSSKMVRTLINVFSFLIFPPHLIILQAA